MIKLCKELYPINRSITGNGVRESLGILRKIIPIELHEVPSGTKVLDWTVPREWNVEEAFVVDLGTGKKIINFVDCNLHLVGYSVPVDKTMDFEELKSHLFMLEEQPDAIPYITSYYKEFWGFCLTYRAYQEIDRNAQFRVVIKSELTDGSLTYADLVIPGALEKEVFISTYICHPSMVNNELSGPVVATYLADWLLQKKERKYTYRFVFIPETIGSITYLSLHLDELKRNVIGGYNISCVGDERNFSYLASRYGNTLADKISVHVLQNSVPYRSYSFLARGSDERQYCAPGIDLPVCSIMRTKFGEYPEYHTSLDNFDLVTEQGLQGSLDIYKKCVELFERNFIPRVTVLGEPQLGKRGLYPSVSTRNTRQTVGHMMDFLAYSDGSNDLVDICNIIGIPYWATESFLPALLKEGVVEAIPALVPRG
jgi:aminopeptidase-like protein